MAPAALVAFVLGCTAWGLVVYYLLHRLTDTTDTLGEHMIGHRPVIRAGRKLGTITTQPVWIAACRDCGQLFADPDEGGARDKLRGHHGADHTGDGGRRLVAVPDPRDTFHLRS